MNIYFAYNKNNNNNLFPIEFMIEYDIPVSYIYYSKESLENIYCDLSEKNIEIILKHITNKYKKDVTYILHDIVNVSNVNYYGTATINFIYDINGYDNAVNMFNDILKIAIKSYGFSISSFIKQED